MAPNFTFPWTVPKSIPVIVYGEPRLPEEGVKLVACGGIITVNLTVFLLVPPIVTTVTAPRNSRRRDCTLDLRVGPRRDWTFDAADFDYAPAL